MAFSNNESRIKECLKVLNLTETNKEYTKIDVINAYHKLAKEVHPDKGGTHDDFLKLSEAYQYALNYFTEPVDETENSAISQALAALYTTISRTESIFNKINSKTIPEQELQNIFINLQLELRKHADKLLSDTPDYSAVKGILEKTKKGLDNEIDNIYKGPTKNQGALIGFSFITIALCAIFALAIWQLGLTLDYISLIELFAVAPVGGILFGAFCFFSTQNADKNRAKLQADMRKISQAIENLATAVSESLPKENDNSQSLLQLGMP